MLVVLLLALLDSGRSAAEDPASTALAGPRFSSPSAPTSQEIARWISDLRHDSFAVRQAAAGQLLAAGMPARVPLLSIADGADPETRAAARRLIALIDQTEFHRRLEAFAADSDGRQGLTLPGWEQFQKLVGSDPAARSLFVDMQRREGPLLSAAFGASKHPPEELLQARLMRLAQLQILTGDRVAPPPVGSCAAMLFLASAAEVEVPDNAIELLLQRPPLTELIRSENRQEPVRRLVVGWILHCPTHNEGALLMRLNTVSNAGLEDALPLALAVASGQSPYKRVQASTRAMATLIVGQLGRPEHIDRLEPLLDDPSICFMQMQAPGQVGGPVQLRDVALVVMLQLTEQRPADYGYVNAVRAPSKVYVIQSLARENDQQRAEAIAKWRAWRAAQKPPAPKTN